MGEMRGDFSTIEPEALPSTHPKTGPIKDSPTASGTVRESLATESDPGAAQIPGITIQGGETESDFLIGRNPLMNRKQQDSYGLTILSSGNNGGGLGDFGVFSDEFVLTVYVEIEDSQGSVLPSWILQCASIENDVAPANSLTPPIATNKAIPRWPAGLADRYRGQLIVVSAAIDERGQFQNLRILQSPRPDLGMAVEDALEKWRFQPATVRGGAVAVKVLLGVPVA